jgi:hypothetical protein
MTTPFLKENTSDSIAAYTYHKKKKYVNPLIAPGNRRDKPAAESFGNSPSINEVYKRGIPGNAEYHYTSSIDRCRDVITDVS